MTCYFWFVFVLVLHLGRHIGQPIHHAASRGQECVLRLLLEKMKRVEIPAEDGIDACDVSGRTALHCCAMTGCLGCVEALLQFGCNVDILVWPSFFRYLFFFQA